MHIPYSPKAAERARQKSTTHQTRRRKRFVEENKRVHEEHFGQRKEFGKRKLTASGLTKPRRTFGIFKSAD